MVLLVCSVSSEPGDGVSGSCEGVCLRSVERWLIFVCESPMTGRAWLEPVCV